MSEKLFYYAEDVDRLQAQAFNHGLLAGIIVGIIGGIGICYLSAVLFL